MRIKLVKVLAPVLCVLLLIIQVNAQSNQKAEPQPTTTLTADEVALFKVIEDRKDLNYMLAGSANRIISLLEKGVNPNVRDSSGMTPLMRAAENSDNFAIVFLLDGNADINAQMPDGTTALMFVVKKDDKSITDLLLFKGANKDIKDKKGRTAYDIAAEVNGSVFGLFAAALKPDKPKTAVRNTTAKAGKEEKSEDEVLDELFQKKAGEMMAEKLRPKDQKPEDSGSASQKSGNGKTSSVKFHIDDSAPVLEVLMDRRELSKRNSRTEKQLRDLLANDADPEVRTSGGNTPLMVAASTNDTAAIQILLNAGVNIDNADFNGQTPLMGATLFDSEDAAKLLMAKGARLDLKDKNGRTAYDMAVLKKGQIIRNLGSQINPDKYANVMKIATGDDPTPQSTPTPAATSNSNGTKHKRPEDVAAMFKALADWDNDQIRNSVSLINLMRGGLDPNVRDSSGRTPLIYAAALKEEPYAALLWLLKSGADINAQSTEDGTTALMEAILHKNSSAMLQLLGAGPKTDLKDKKGRTAYDIAVEVNDPLVLTLTGMLKPEAVQIITQTAPTDKAKHNKPDQIAVLFRMINYRKDKQHRGSDSLTLLQDLLKLGVNPDARDASGLTPLMRAAAFGDDTAVNILMSDGADINAQSIQEGMTPLMGAAQKGEFGAIGALLLYKPRLDIKDKKGRTAYDIALETGGVTMMLYGSQLKPE